MDSGKPGVYIPAARMVDPNVYLNARSLSGSSSTGSIPIRAPITVDDDESDLEVYNSDFEFNGPKSVSNDSNSSSYSSEVEFGTDEEEFESASAGLDDEVAEISAVLNRNNSYRLSGENAAGLNVVLGGLRVSESVLDDEGTSESCYASFDDEDDIPNPKIVIPRANLSMEDDEIDHLLDSEGEDIGFSGLVNIPSTSDPNVEFSGVESEVSFIGEPGIEALVLDESVSGEGETVDANDSNDGSVLIKSDEENGPDVEPEVDLGSPANSTCEEEFLKERPGDNKAVDGCVGSPMLRNHSEDFENEFDAMKESVKEVVTICSDELENVELETGVCQEDNGGSVLDEADNLGTTEGEINSGNSEISHLGPTQESLSAGNNEIVETDDGISSGTLPDSMDFVEPHQEKLQLDSEGEDSGKMAKSLLLSDEDVNGLKLKILVENADTVAKNKEQKSLQTIDEDVLDSGREANQEFGKTRKRLSCSNDHTDSLTLTSLVETTDKGTDEVAYAELVDSSVVSESDHVEAHVLAEIDEFLLPFDKGFNNQSSGASLGTNDETTKFEDKHSGLISNQGSVYQDSISPLRFCSREEESSSYFSELGGLEEASTDYITRYISEEKKEDSEKMQPVSLKFLKLVKRLGLSPDDSVVTEAMDLAKTFGSDKTKAMELEEEGEHDVRDSLNIIVLGKTGVGKSAVINSIFSENKSVSGAFEPTTSVIKELNGIVDGIKIRVLDTPGLRPSSTEERFNQRILSSVKKRLRKFPTDVILYIDRLDEPCGSLCDSHLLRAITGSLGSSVWKNSILVLTHAASIDHEDFIAQRSSHLQRAICLAIGDSTLANPMPKVVLAENNTELFRENEVRECLFGNWRQQLMLFCYSLKILSNASSMLKVERPVDETEPFESRLQSFSVFYHLWDLLNPRVYPRRSFFDCKYDTVVIPDPSERNNQYFSDSSFEKLSKVEKKYFPNEFVQGEELKIITGEQEKYSLHDSTDPGFAETRNVDDCYNQNSTGRRNLDVAMAVRRAARESKRRFSINLDSAGCKADMKTPFPVGRGSRLSFGVRMNKEGKGRICVRLSGSEQVQLVICGFLPVLVALFSRVYSGCHKKQQLK